MLIIDNHKLESLRKHLNCPDLQVYAYAEWGSKNPDHRQLIHAHRDRIVLNSATPLHSSIAHTQGMGILVISPHPVGVDIESTSRITEPAVKRVARPGEYEQAPSAASLWTAKEACFKALRTFKQPSVLSGFSVGSWQKIASQFETFSLLEYSEHHAPSGGAGICFHEQNFSFGFFCVNL
ncbi:4'-phosphopantetheinyl transferase family protein [Bdellovibrio sp. HCB209]|uniref:4'-phosphopantetheinyl transferase family protein n=1 Tax=Bdellovibrio sp. HCB209 TaxID=3394354 RepID=UPI0039B528A3